MSNSEGETTIGGAIPAKMAEEFDRQRAERRQVKKGCIEAAIRLWLSLSAEQQAGLLNRSLSGSALLDLIQQIVDDRILEAEKAGKTLADMTRRKRSGKG